MSSPNEIAERYSETRPGFRLLQCEDAALPFFWLTLDALVQAKKRLPPLHEYVMRTIAAGLDTVTSVAGFLGVEVALVERTAADLWKYDYLDYPSLANIGRSLRLTREGLASLEELVLQGPERREIWIAFDRVLWEPVLMRRNILLPPREIKDLDVLEVKPSRQARPELTDLDVGAIDEQLKQVSRAGGESLDVLAVHRVLRAERMFLPSHLLVYQSADAKEVELGVAIDGRPSPRHEDAIAGLGGHFFLGLTVEQPAAEAEVSITSGAGRQLEDIRSAAVPLEEVARIRTRTAQSAAEIDNLSRAQAIDGTPIDEVRVSEAASAIAEERASVDSLAIREIDTFEHTLLFDQFRRNTRRRLLVISPWISGNVVTGTMLGELRRLAQKKVQIRVGYGISDDRAMSERDRHAEDQLLKLAKEFSNVVVARLGDTHAKVLVSDDALIVGSFNWLSFRGDKNRTYRQERGILVQVKATANSSYEEHSARIEAAARS